MRRGFAYRFAYRFALGLAVAGAIAGAALAMPQDARPADNYVSLLYWIIGAQGAIIIFMANRLFEAPRVSTHNELVAASVRLGDKIERLQDKLDEERELRARLNDEFHDLKRNYAVLMDRMGGGGAAVAGGRNV